jgi:hypothetical protein
MRNIETRSHIHHDDIAMNALPMPLASAIRFARALRAWSGWAVERKPVDRPARAGIGSERLLQHHQQH